MDALNVTGKKLAIIIPCYNYEFFVKKAIDSVISQDNSDYELVVVDDGSTDNSWGVIQSSGVRCFRVTNRGPRLACIYALGKTTAPFVLFLDADDELKPGAISKIISNIDMRVSKLQFPLTRINQDGKFISGASPALKDFRDSVKLKKQVAKDGVYNSPPTSGNVFRRDVCDLLKQCSYDNSVDGFTLFAAPFLGDIVSVSDEIGMYRVHSKNLSSIGLLPSAKAMEYDMIRLIKRMDHLREFIKSRENYKNLFISSDTFAVRERKFYLDILENRATSFKHLSELIRRTMYSGINPIKVRFMLSLFFLILFFAPNEKAKKLLAYRLIPGRRTIQGAIYRIIRN